VAYETALKVLQIEAEAIRDLIPKVGDSFGRAIDMLFACTGRVVTTGMGKSGFIAQKLSATLSSTGTPSLFLHPAEAIHGDLGRIVKGDVVIAIVGGADLEGHLFAGAAVVAHPGFVASTAASIEWE
jgi:arabinose-5-phosphate isomerase